MAFSSLSFLCFFLPAALALYYLTPGVRGKNAVLLLMGLLFYALGQLRGLPWLLAAALVNYLAGLVLRGGRFRRLTLAAAVACNLALLGCCKYLGLFLPQVSLLAPLGVSFFTFKGISYLVDAYRKPENATGNFARLLLYLSFFPELVSGPISRFSDFRPQLDERAPDWEQVALGLRRFIVGLGKKLFLSVPLTAISSAAFEAASPDIRLAWLGAVAYTLELYLDFSGYTDMAVGLAAMLGITSPENFNYPLTSLTVGEFWRRWHMTLSGWFRDYLYIPLGGNRRGRARAALNRCVVFILCGVWHGAGWTFLLWGCWHGLFISLESLGVLPVARLKGSRGGRVVSHLYLILVVVLGFVLFRSVDLVQAGEMFSALFTGFALNPASTLALERIPLTSWLALAFGVAASAGAVPFVKDKLTALPMAHRDRLTGLSCAGAVLMLALCLIAAAAGNFQPFIYAQF